MAVESADVLIDTDIDIVQVTNHVRRSIDDELGDLDALLATPGAGSSRTASPSREASGHAKRRKRTLEDQILYWERLETEHEKKLLQSRAAIPKLLQETQTKLQAALEEAQALSLQRYSIADKLDNLASETSSQSRLQDAGSDGESAPGGGHPTKREPTVLEQLDRMQDDLARLEAGLAWVSVLERVVALSERILAPNSHHPSPLAALGVYRQLVTLVQGLQNSLPADMALLSVVVDVRQQTWHGLKEIMTQTLIKASEPLRWPQKTAYADATVQERRAFETAYIELLYLQAEGEALHGAPTRPPTWSSGTGLYPLQALVQPIALRFKYHFQGTRNTNRNDKPEWAFAHILDQIYEHQKFIEQYLQPLTERAGYLDIDVKSEFAMLLFPILLNLLRSRIPHLLSHPALLAHTIYQTIVFDDAVREGGFDIGSVSVNEGKEGCEWEGLAGVLLRDQDWFDQWLTGERKFAETQLHDIISAENAWTITDELPDDDDDGDKVDVLKPTISARQVRTLIEQITDRYSPLPLLEYRLPFLTTIQLPLLSTYLARISGSLDAFERLSYTRAIPGALTGNTRTGAYLDQSRITQGAAGLERLIKAYMSALYVDAALRRWADAAFFIELSSELKDSPVLRYRLQTDGNLPKPLRMGGDDESTSVFDAVTERYSALLTRVEEMIVRHVATEVENDLKQHLTRRWDQTQPDEHEPDSSLLNGITALSSALSTIASTLPSLPTSRIYRHTISHLNNHLFQRVVYAGWSKFTVIGGADLLHEVSDWRSACLTALPKILGGEQAVDAPWAKLESAAKVLALPTGEAKDGEATFAQAMAAAWVSGAETRIAFLARAGASEMGQDELQGLLRRRVDCWR